MYCDGSGQENENTNLKNPAGGSTPSFNHSSRGGDHDRNLEDGEEISNCDRDRGNEGGDEGVNCPGSVWRRRTSSARALFHRMPSSAGVAESHFCNTFQSPAASQGEHPCVEIHERFAPMDVYAHVLLQVYICTGTRAYIS